MRLVLLCLVLLVGACRHEPPAASPGVPPATAAATTPVVAAAPAGLPPGAQPLSEAYRGLFERCDREDRFGGIALPILSSTGQVRWYGCRSDPSRLTSLLRWPDRTVAWEAKLAVDLDGSFYACSTPGMTDQCPTSLMLRDPATGREVPVDSDTIPYVVIPLAGPATDPTRPGVSVPREFRDTTGIAIGDLGVVLYQGRVVPVIVADGGPFNKMGEGSMALHRALGRELCAARDAAGRCTAIRRPLSGIEGGVVTVVFPGSRPAGLRPDTIGAVVARDAMARWRAFAGG